MGTKKIKIQSLAFLDSGYGGLLTASYIHKVFPHINIICILDNANMPYGTKEIADLNIRYAQLQKIAKREKTDLAIIACNTLSATSFITEDKLVETIDIISISLDYLNKQEFDNLTILATSNTVKSNIYPKGLKKNNNISQIPAPELASLIENHTIDEAIKYFKQLIPNRDRTVFLGCTHYSALIPLLSEYKLYSQLSILSNYLSENYELEIEQLGKVKIIVNSEMEKYKKFADELFSNGDTEVTLESF